VSKARVALTRYSLAEALKQVCAILHVSLVEAVSFVASYYGSLNPNGYVFVVVKAKKGDESGIDVEVKSDKEGISKGLLDELTAAL